jgi:hypothetical protein
VNTREVQEHLRTIGWPIAADGAAGPQTARAVRDFQGGWAFYELAVDGQAGPKTQQALRECVQRGGRCAAHFAFREFKCKCPPGEQGGCNGWILISRVHAFRLDSIANAWVGQWRSSLVTAAHIGTVRLAAPQGLATYLATLPTLEATSRSTK